MSPESVDAPILPRTLVAPPSAEVPIRAEEAPARPGDGPAAAAPDRAHALARASAALSMAGRALDPNASLGAEADVAIVLLRESVLWVARSLSLTEIATFDDAVRVLDETGVLARAFGDAAKGREKLARLELSSPPPVAVADAEVVVIKVLEAARGRRTTSLHEKVLRWSVGVFAAVAVVFVLGAGWMHPWWRYRFKASSAWGDFHESGVLGDAKPHALLFHTNEEEEPWVDIDLLGPRKIHSVLLRNRFDCCQSRGVPLVVEVSTTGSGWQVVGRRDEIFDVWTATFDPMEARRVRIRSVGRNVLHLSEIQIR